MLKQKEVLYVITCEHATNFVPTLYSKLFEHNVEVLCSHSGYDIGALDFAHYLSRKLNATLFVGEVSRLLIELNRSPENREIWSRYSEVLGNDEKEQLMERYYHFYRDSVEAYIERALALGLRVLHISVHTFTPVLNDVPREVDIGILFDPERSLETNFAQKWLNQLSKQNPHLILRPNEPYHGTDDGFTSYLRKQFANEVYAGIEIEIKNTQDPDLSGPLLDEG